MTNSPTIAQSKVLRVLHVVESWPPVHSGYTARSARMVESQHARADLEPFVAVTSRQHMYRGNPRERGPASSGVSIAPESARERRVRRVRRFHIDRRSFERWLNKELLRLRPDIVHVHWSSVIGDCAVRAGHQHGIPVVAEVRFDLAGAIWPTTSAAHIAPVERRLRRYFERHLKFADAIIAPSEPLAALIHEHTGVLPVVIENAVGPIRHVESNEIGPLRSSHGVDPANHHTWDTGTARLREIYADTIRARHTPGRKVHDHAHTRSRDPRLNSSAPDRAERISRVVDPAVADTAAGKSGRLVVVGAGPAGLTAALEAARRTGLQSVVLEASNEIGGISRTVEFEGNLIDIGGHRFFSKSDRVNDWWLDVLPLAAGATWRGDDPTDGPDPHTEDQVMLVRQRRSQILWNGNLFDYPLELSFDVLRKLGFRRTLRAGASYMRSQAFPVSPVDNLEDFYINRFGRELYRTFFESYTEKVWGLPCREISPDWGAQRVKGLSLWGALWHAVKPKSRGDVAQRNVATSLVERFLYPKYGPGQMWETAASRVIDAGGEVLTDVLVTGFEFHEPEFDETSGVDVPAGGTEPRISAVTAIDRLTGNEISIAAEHVVSTMPLNLLVKALGSTMSDSANEIADGLAFRDFITVGVLVDKLLLTESDGRPLLDNWLYIQEPHVLVGRLQIFNNWSPWMVADPIRSWIGLEYFCDSTDPMWSWSQDRLVRLAGQELATIGVIEPGSVISGCSIKVRRAYPSYVGTYDRLPELQPELDAVTNLWCAGRNGQHRYNNQDHSMLAAMLAVDQIETGVRNPDEIWSVNIDDDYHEQ